MNSVEQTKRIKALEAEVERIVNRFVTECANERALIERIRSLEKHVLDLKFDQIKGV